MIIFAFKNDIYAVMCFKNIFKESGKFLGAVKFY